jgi:multisubunit Na+/H+ antiporter MnhB subunit
MNERWKHQTKSGLTWAIVTLLMLTAFDYKNNTWEKFLYRSIVFTIIGVFFLGYLSWKRKVKTNNKK